jgi:hypothetical protein
MENDDKKSPLDTVVSSKGISNSGAGDGTDTGSGSGGGLHFSLSPDAPRLALIGMAIVLPALAFAFGWMRSGMEGVLNVLIIFIILLLAGFPFYLYYSFQQIKKDRIRGDIWTDLMYLGYWPKLKFSAQASRQMAQADANTGTGSGTLRRIYADTFAAAKPVPRSAAGATLDGQMPATPPPPDDLMLALTEFNFRMEEHFGAAAFFWPLVITTVLYVLGWFAVLAPVGLASGAQRLTQQGFGDFINFVGENLSVVSASFMGAYLFSMQSLFRRYVRSDLKPAALTQAGLRVIIAAVAAFLLMLNAGNNSVPLKLAGFFAGIFPWSVLQYLWDIVSSRIPIGKAALSGINNAEVTELDGVDAWDKDRLDEAGINYVDGLATVDFMDLLLTVRMPTETLVDWVDQALLRIHLSKDAWVLIQQQTPLRTATDFLDVMRGGQQAKLSELIGTTVKGAAMLSSSGLALLVTSLLRDPNIAYIETFRTLTAQAGLPSAAFPPGLTPPLPAAPIVPVVPVVKTDAQPALPTVSTLPVASTDPQPAIPSVPLARTDPPPSP